MGVFYFRDRPVRARRYRLGFQPQAGVLRIFNAEVEVDVRARPPLPVTSGIPPFGEACRLTLLCPAVLVAPALA